jgi:hypothetical protein
MEVSVQLPAPAALLPGERHSVSVDRTLSGAQSRFGRSGIEK